MTFEPRKKLRIIVLVHEDLVPPDSLNGLSDKEKLEVKTEYDVISTLKKMGHEVYPVGLYNQLNVIGNALMEHKPHIAFNLLEEFHGYPLYDQHVVSYLELMKQAYTGCNPRGMTLAHDKALTKMILSYHRLLVPNFAVFPMNRKVRRPKRLKFPLLVKSISEEGSVGIAQASIAEQDCGDCGAVHQGARDLCGCDWQSEHPDVCALGARDGETTGRRGEHRDPESEVGSGVPGKGWRCDACGRFDAGTDQDP
jgi:hypothetical protein